MDGFVGLCPTNPSIFRNYTLVRNGAESPKNPDNPGIVYPITVRKFLWID
jgi:hypothetical protein